MAIKRETRLKHITPRSEALRRQVVSRMLAERDQRQRVPREEIRRMRDEGRY